MIEIIKRLSILLVSISFFGCLIVAYFAHYKSENLQQSLEIIHKEIYLNVVECEKNRDSVMCGLIKNNQDLFDITAKQRDSYKDLVEAMLYSAIIIPLCIIFLFCSVIWVLTGKNHFKKSYCAK